MFVSVVMPWDPRCFRCTLEILLGPTAVEFVMYLMTRLVSSVVASVVVGSRVN